jgi:hypothetical protein
MTRRASERRRHVAWFAGLYAAALLVYALVAGAGHLLVEALK